MIAPILRSLVSELQYMKLAYKVTIMKFKEFVSSEVSEAYKKGTEFEKTKEAVRLLELSLHPNSKIAKELSKEMGKDYKDDFKKMQKHLNEIISIWEQIYMDVTLQE